MPIRTVSLLQAPAAEPRAISQTIPADDWLEIMDAPQYEIPDGGFASSGTVIAPGVIEISSPLLITNLTDAGARVSAQIVRDNGDVSTIAIDYPVPVADALMLPLQGQFLLAGDIVRVKADTADALDATISWTEGQAEQGVESVD